MPRYKRKFTEAKKKKWEKEGRGQGHGENFKPWYTVRDVASQGLCSRVRGLITRRVHHLLSRKEYYFFLIVDFCSRVLDIREQFPLPREVTLEIAARLGIKHPMDPWTKVPVVMTTDFLLDFVVDDKTVLIARTIKMTSKLKKKRTLEKLEIERTYWQERGIDWAIVTERDIPIVVAKNIRWIRSAYYLEDFPSISKELLLELEELLFHEIASSHKPLATITSAVDNSYCLSPGICLLLARHLIARRIWPVDIYSELGGNRPLIVSKSRWSSQRETICESSYL